MLRVSRKFRNHIEISQPAVYIYKTAIYTRLSFEDVRKKISDSIGTQKALLMDYLKSQYDMQLCGVYA